MIAFNMDAQAVLCYIVLQKTSHNSSIQSLFYSKYCFNRLALDLLK